MAKTELILYKPNVIYNGKFVVQNNYGWLLTPSGGSDYPFVKVDGSITKLPNVSGANIRQDFVFLKGKTYRLRFTMQGYTTGIVTFRCAEVYYDPAQVATGAIIVSPSADGDYDVTFVADGNSLIINWANTNESSILNVSVVESPEVFVLDTTDDINIPLNFNVDSVNKLNTRKSNFSKSILLPGTDNNNKAFDHIYKVNSETGFNPNYKSKCLIKNSGITVFEGVLCLDNVTHTYKKNIENIQYSVSVYGEALNLFDQLGDRAISELDFSMYDHEFTLGRINACWQGDIKIFGTYSNPNRDVVYTSPPIASIGVSGATSDLYVNYIQAAFVQITFSAPHSFSVGDDIYIDCDHYQMIGDQTVIAVPSSTVITIAVQRWWGLGSPPSITGTCYISNYKGIGYWYPMTDNGKYQTTAFTGGQTRLTSGLLEIGVTYTIQQWYFNDDFTNVGAPSNTGGTTFVATGTTPTRWTSGSELTTSSGRLEIGRSYYIQQVQYPDDFTNVGAASNNHGEWFIATGTTPTSFINAPDAYGRGTLLYQLDPQRETLATHDAFINHWVVDDFIPHIFVYEVLVKIFAMLDLELDAPFFDSQFFKRLVMPLDQKFSLTDVVTSGQLVVGQQYMIYDYNSSDDFTNIGAASNASGVIFNATGSTPADWAAKSKLAMMVNFNNWLPKMKMKDFVLSVLNMFNLIFYEDKQNKKLIHVVNRADYFGSTIVDWSDKLHAEDDIKMTMSNKLLPTYYNFKYKDSSDYFNTNYNEDYANQSNNYGTPQQIDRRYGDQPIFNRADFAKDPNIVEIKFEPTVQAGPIQPVVESGTIISEGIYADSDKTLSPCYYADDDGSNIKRQTAQRIFLISIKGTDTPWTFNSETTPAEDISDVTIGSYSQSFYPWAGHTDSQNKYCILFGPPVKNYSAISNPTKRGIYTQFYKIYTDELRNINSKIVECTVKLSAYDIYNIDFTVLYRIGDFVMKLNKITDWNANGNGLCKAEFLLKN